jgi:carboxypeptidase Q
MKKVQWLGAIGLSLVLQVSLAQDRADLKLVNQLRDEGINRSKVMEPLAVLTDEIGSRLTGSPGLKQAAQWTRDKLAQWGMQGAHIESFAPFGRGWTFEKSSLRMLSPVNVELPAIPKAWTSGTTSPIRGRALYVKLETEEDLQKWRGKLEGSILLLSPPHQSRPHLKPDALRYNDEQLAELLKIDLNGSLFAGREPGRLMRRFEFEKKLNAFLIEEKVAVVLSNSPRDDGTIVVQSGGSYKLGEPDAPPSLVVMADAYNRVLRLLEKNKVVELEVDVKANYLEEDPQAAVSVFADISGSDKKDELVMVGAHLDSWHGATGATDNAAGVSIAMEAMRLLNVLGFKPRRTIRLGLWGGEEQGLLGSRAYVSKTFAVRGEPPDAKNSASFFGRSSGPLTLKPQHSKVSAYFNVDEGGGKIRGIYTEGNAAIKPVFDAWFLPFNDLGAATVSLRKVQGSDHQSFDNVGLPGFHFMQDPLDYETRTHHTNVDVYDKVQKGDLMQAAIILASFVAHAANREELLPRKPLPQPSEAVKK